MSSNFVFGTVGSPKSTPPKPGGSVGAIKYINTLNLGCLELGWVQSVRVSEETCAIIQTTMHENNILISVHAPYFINLNADADEWPKSRRRLMDAAHYGFLAGATDIVFHPGSYFGKPPDEVLPIVIERLQGCVDELRQSNNTVTLRLETMGKSAMLGTLQDTIKMSKAVKGVLPCIDFAHLHARAGDGSINSKIEWIALLNDYAQSLGKSSLHNLHIHLSGIQYGPKGEKEHLPVRESDLNVLEIFYALKELDCSGRILCESPLLEEDAIYLQDTWRSLSDFPPLS
jgi:deoxyribonuclease-4